MRLPQKERDYLLFRLLLNVEEEGACTVWQGGVNSKGYGTISVAGKNLYVHRVMYALMKGPVPDGVFVCHHCDNRRCIKPDHLFLGHPIDNYEDMRLKGKAFVFSRWLPPKEFLIEVT